MAKVFHLYIRTEDDAFTPDPRRELARLLYETAARLENGATYDTFRTIFDVNGNDVGRFAIKEGYELKEVR